MMGTKQLRDLHIGQSYDIHWMRHISNPPIEEHLDAVAKSFCEDLEEGKLSFPLVHYLATAKTTLPLREIMQQRQEHGGSSLQLKKPVLD
ncbi:hypothetical protein OQA88_3476 [Cercophora sp. LCS_1]